ncbi:MAG TPA: Smr/MutS family protein [Thermodesulfovibrionales bacterium]|nr:Smr/MutS family protein [Thermodesulfovibrionales bacterium]
MKSTDRNEAAEGQGPVEIPIDGVLDLHTFNPREVKDLLPHYLNECRRRGILEVRVVHGKGGGTLRKTVHTILGRLSEVSSFRLAQEDAGGWGATIVILNREKQL